MESVLKLSAVAQQPFGVGDAIKSWFGLFNLFLETDQIVIADNLHASVFSDIATSQELLKHQLQIITFSHFLTILGSGKDVKYLPFESAGVAVTSSSSSFTDCEYSFASIDLVAASKSNCEKVGVTSSAVPIRDSTSVLVVKSFPNRSFLNSIQYSIPNYPPRCVIELPVIRKSFVLPTITINPGRKPPQPRIDFSKLLHLILPIIHLPPLTSSAEHCEPLQISEEDTILP